MCGASDTYVKNSRACSHNLSIRRRRVCACGHRFTTIESCVERPVYVIKRSGARKLLEKSKIVQSILTATRKRHVDIDIVHKIAENIVAVVESSGSNEIHTEAIGAMILQALKEVDVVAYIRFASVYKNFASLKDFGEFIGGIS